MAVLALLLATSVLPGFQLDTSVPRWWVAMLRLPIVFALLLILLRPLLLFLTLPLNGFTLGLPTLLFNGFILWLASQAEPAFRVGHYGDAFLGSLIMVVVSSGIVGQTPWACRGYEIESARRLGVNVVLQVDQNVKAGK